MKVLKTLSILLLVSFFIWNGFTKVQAEEDNTPPVVHYVDFSPVTDIDVTTGSQIVTVRAHVTDDLSGVENVSPGIFIAPSGQQRVYVTDTHLISGNTLDGIWEGTAEFPQYTESGVWTLGEYGAYDVLRNTVQGDPSEFYPEHNIYLNVLSVQDNTAPVLHYVDFAPVTQIDTTLGSQTVTVRAHVTDDLSGVENVSPGIFIAPSGQHIVYVTDTRLISGNNLDGIWEGTAEFDQYSEDGAWRLGEYGARDAINNTVQGDASEFYPEHNIYLNVLSVQDNTPPVVHYVDFSPVTEIDTTLGSQYVTVRAHVTDDISGVVNVGPGTFVAPSGQHIVYVTNTHLISGDNLDGVWEGTAEFPQFSEYGIWTLREYGAYDVLRNTVQGDPSEFYPEYNIYLRNGAANEQPIAEAGADQTVILGETVSFDGSGSSDPDGSIVSYVWDFGDGTTGSGETTTHDYTAAGTYTVTLTVMDDDGATATDTLIVMILTPEEAIEELITDVDGLDLPLARERLLKAELNLAIRFLNQGRIPAAKLSLYTFIWHVNRLERLGLLTEEVAIGLVSSAQQIIASI